MSRVWVRVDVDYLRRDELVDVGPMGRLLALAGLLFVKEQESDGLISDKALRGIGHREQIPDVEAVAEQLVEGGLWERIETGYRIVGFLENNLSAAEIEARRENTSKVRRLSGSKGKHARLGHPGTWKECRLPACVHAKDRHEGPYKKCPKCRERLANDLANVPQTAAESRDSRQTSDKPLTKPDSEAEAEPEPQSEAEPQSEPDLLPARLDEVRSKATEDEAIPIAIPTLDWPLPKWKKHRPEEYEKAEAKAEARARAKPGKKVNVGGLTLTMLREDFLPDIEAGVVLPIHGAEPKRVETPGLPGYWHCPTCAAAWPFDEDREGRCPGCGDRSKRSYTRDIDVISGLPIIADSDIYQLRCETCEKCEKCSPYPDHHLPAWGHQASCPDAPEIPF